MWQKRCVNRKRDLLQSLTATVVKSDVHTRKERYAKELVTFESYQERIWREQEYTKGRPHISKEMYRWKRRPIKKIYWLWILWGEMTQWAIRWLSKKRGNGTFVTFQAYDSFHWKYYIPKVRQIEILRFLGISRCQFKLRFWFDLNLYQGIWVFEFGGFRRGRIFSGICHVRTVYGVATVSRLLEIIHLFCRISSLLQGCFAKETYNSKEPTNCNHPICKVQEYPQHDKI